MEEREPGEILPEAEGQISLNKRFAQKNKKRSVKRKQKRIQGREEGGEKKGIGRSGNREARLRPWKKILPERY